MRIIPKASSCPVCSARWPASHAVCPNDGAALVTVGGVEVGEWESGVKVGDYVVVGKIGEGGMAHVYSAVHAFLGKKVAIKVIRAEMCASAATIQRFLQEARTISQIGHPNIIDVHAYGTLPDGRCYFIMEWLSGQTLAKIIDQGPLPVPQAAAFLVQICDALDAAHRAGVVHRDLKPDNVYVVTLASGHNLVKVLDFGIAKLVRAPNAYPRTRTGLTMGTPEYVSPEQARGRNVSPRSDIYSLGVLAFEMLAQRLPFLANNDADMMVAHLLEVAPLISTLRPDVPPSLDPLIAAMLSKTPDERPSLATIRGELLALAGPMAETASGRTVPAALAEDLPEAPPPRRRRPLRGQIALAAAFVTFAVSPAPNPVPSAELLPASLPAPSSFAATVPLASPPAPARPAPRPMATLSLRVVPPNARVTVDGMPVELREGRASLSFETEELHKVVAEASGHLPMELAVAVPRAAVIELPLTLMRRALPPKLDFRTIDPWRRKSR